MGEPSNLSATEVNPRVSHPQYLVTYSKTNKSKFFIKESFGEILETEFNAVTSAAKVNYWDCSKEEHHNNSFPYHYASKLTGCKKMAVNQKQTCRKTWYLSQF